MPKSELWTDSKKHQRLRDMNYHSQRTELGRTRCRFSAGQDKTGQSTEFLSLEKLFVLCTMAAVAITNGSPVWAKSNNNKNGQILNTRTREPANTKQRPPAQPLPRASSPTAGCRATLADERLGHDANRSPRTLASRHG